jgi:hypothetical protein
VRAEDTAAPLSAIARLGFDAFEVIDIVPLKLPADDGVSVTLNDVLCPGVKVSGGLIPDMLNSVPLTVAAEIVAFTPPVFVTVSVWVLFCPTTTLLNVRRVGVSVSVAGLTAVPLNATVRPAFDAFEVMVILPLKLFADGGVKVTLNDALCPGVNVSGVLIPDRPKPAPVTVAAAIVVFTPPVFFTVSVCVWFCPTTTLVKVRLAGVAVNAAGVTAVPLNAMDKLASDAFEVRDAFPLKLPADEGVSVTLNDALCPGLRVRSV